MLGKKNCFFFNVYAVRDHVINNAQSQQSIVLFPYRQNKLFCAPNGDRRLDIMKYETNG